MPNAPQEIVDLVAAFQLNLHTYTSSAYNEAQVRAEFIDKFFTCLGWDISNRANNAPQYREVITESLIQSGAGTPDYTFRIGPEVVFFVEAKKPQVDVGADVAAAFQLRKYAWNARLKTSILTDFHEFAVYDCQLKPTVGARASDARVLYLTYDQYPGHWDEIAAKFSREAVLRGGYDTWASANTGKKGTQTVDAAFLADMSAWRELLAHNLALRNPTLSDSALNYAVQMTLDRIVFWRICEDRGLEPFEQLLRTTQSKDIYPRLLDLFRLADQRYNSGLFHFASEKGRESPDALTPTLRFDDQALKEIISKLYWPAPYDFNQMPVEILGRVYEQFLGSVIRLTPSHQAKIDLKPEVRKAGGVYYTPQYIVRYIVEHTVGELLKDKAPADVVDLAICDPACGSGSFLLGAYEYLLGWYLDWYTAHPTRQPRQEIYQGRGGWRLTVAEKKRILLAHIYGVDIDQQAVEVTKLSLLLKVLEGENQGSVQQLQLLRDRVLPDMGNNILCGNSLIGWDYPGAASLSSDDLRRINPFDWQKAFPRAFARSGFDAVIGNPPYVRQELLGTLKSYFQQHYQVYHGIADLYAYFIERGVNLLRRGGLFSYIVANKWMRANYGAPLRRWLKEQQIEEIIDFSDLPVFRNATTYPCIIRVARSSAAGDPDSILTVVQVKTLEFTSLDDYVHTNSYIIEQQVLAESGWSLGGGDTEALLTKLRAAGVPLGEYAQGKIYRGILTGLNEAFVVDDATREHLIVEDPRSAELIMPFLVGKDVKCYAPLPSGRWLILMPRGWTREHFQGTKNAWQWLQKQYPAIATHLAPYAEAAQKRYDKGEYWWELRACAYYDEFRKAKIIWPGISSQVTSFAFDADGYYGNDNNQIIISEDKYLLGILNASISRLLLKHICDKVQGGFYRLKIIYVKQLPIRTIDLSSPADVARHDQMVQLVERMLQLHKDLAAAATPHDRELLERQISATDMAIDRLVYELYDLTPEEIALVEGGG